MYNLYEIHLEKIYRYFLSGRYMFLAENSIMEGPPVSANCAISCKFDDSSPATGLPQILLTDKPFPGSCPVLLPQVMQRGSFCQVGLSIWHPCRNPLKAAKEFCQNCDCSLKEPPPFSLKSISCQQSCYIKVQ